MINYFIDSHCHIQSIGNEDSTGRLWSSKGHLTQEAVIKASLDKNVKLMIAVGCNLKDSLLAAKLANNYSCVLPAIGIHPHETKDFLASNQFHQFEAMINDSIVAIGECGLDYYYHHSDPTSQQKLLIWQLQLAKKYNLPLIFHVRQAFDDFWPIIKDFLPLKAVLHSFTDDQKNLFQALDNNFMIGVNGIATFMKTDQEIEMLKSIPLDHLILETDSPYLTPVPYRGTINTPKNVFYITEYLSKLRKEDFNLIRHQTSFNTVKLFNLKGV
jgi:TatD DNase family protein